MTILQLVDTCERAYRPEIDGLRALAVLSITFFHFGLGFSGGYTGVDVFFVISGYLITRKLASDIDSGNCFWLFWIRRMRRLFPALAVVLIFVILTGYIVMHTKKYADLCVEVRAVLFGIGNLYFYNKVNYFFSTLQSPLLHCWSLAVEEQFYLLYPVLLWCLYQLGLDWNRTFQVIAVLTMVSFCASMAVAHTSPNFAFYLLPTRSWQLMLGGLIVFVSRSHVVFSKGRLAEVASLFGLVLIVSSCFLFTATAEYPRLAAALPCSGAAIFILSQQEGITASGIMMSHPLVTFIGKISYSLYLWHWPVYVFMAFLSENYEVPTQLKIMGILGLLPLAAFSYWCIESPFRQEAKVPLRAFLPMVAMAWLLLVLMTFVPDGGLAHMRHRLWRDMKLVNQTTHIVVCDVSSKRLSTFMETDVPGSECVQELTAVQAAHVYTTSVSAVSAESISASPGWQNSKYSANWEPVLVGPDYPVKHPSIAVIGDSHCLMWGQSIEDLAVEYGVTVGFLCVDGQAGMFDSKFNTAEKDNHRLSYLDKWQPDMVVFFNCFYGDFEIMPTVRQVLKRAKRFLIFGDAPAIPWGPDSPSDGLSMEAVLRQGEKEGNWEFLNKMKEMQKYAPERIKLEAKMERATEDPESLGRVSFVPVSHLFISNITGNLMPIDPCQGTIVYKDFGHVNRHGAQRAEPLFRKHLFEQAVCEGSAALVN